MGEAAPGYGPERLARLVGRAVEGCALDLSGRLVVTEAATGAYVVTPVLAAAAGARVVAVTRPSRYGSVDEVRAQTAALAAAAGVAGRIEVTDKTRPAELADADVVTNSGHLRPLDADLVERLRPGCAIPLMFEAWEIQAGRVDVDLDAVRRRGLPVAGTNERHPAVDVFSYLGPMAVRLLQDGGVACYRSTVAVACDNPFAPFLERGLRAAGADVRVAGSVAAALDGPAADGLLVALTPRDEPVLTAADAVALAAEWPGAVVAQFWGDTDRAALAAAGVAVVPAAPPPWGHMGVLPSGLGPEPVVRLQAGGLKAAQVLLTPPDRRTAADLAFLDPLS